MEPHVGAVYDRAFFMESTKYARSQTAPTWDLRLLGHALEGGVAAPTKQMEHYLRFGAAGEVKLLCNKILTSPAAPYFKVARRFSL